MCDSRLLRALSITATGFMIGVITHATSHAESEAVGVEERSVIASNPKPHEAVNGAMVQVSVCFRVPVDHAKSVLTLRGQEGERQLKPRLEASTNCLFSIVGQLQAGWYLLDWEALLSDGGTETGTIPFTVSSKLASK